MHRALLHSLCCRSCQECQVVCRMNSVQTTHCKRALLTPQLQSKASSMLVPVQRQYMRAARHVLTPLQYHARSIKSDKANNAAHGPPTQQTWQQTLVSSSSRPFLRLSARHTQQLARIKNHPICMAIHPLCHSLADCMCWHALLHCPQDMLSSQKPC